MEHLNLSGQVLHDDSTERDPPAPVQGLHVLDNLPRLRSVRMLGFEDGADVHRFRMAKPSVDLVLEPGDGLETEIDDMPGNCVLC